MFLPANFYNPQGNFLWEILVLVLFSFVLVVLVMVRLCGNRTWYDIASWRSGKPVQTTADYPTYRWTSLPGGLRRALLPGWPTPDLFRIRTGPAIPGRVHQNLESCTTN